MGQDANETNGNAFKNGHIELKAMTLAKSKDIEGDTAERKNHHGISMWTAVIFVVGENAGCGLLALPMAMAGTGWVGAAVVIACCINAGYAGVCLAKCWLILEERWDEYKIAMRYPYGAIGERAVGKWMRLFVSICIQATLVGAGIVFLLLTAELVRSLISDYVGISFCLWVVILGIILWPLMWLGTPQDFWPAAVAAMLTTAIACLLLLINIILDFKAGTHKEPYYAPATFSSFFLAFGTISFAYGGTCVFPTIQNDMRDKNQFPLAVIIGFVGLIILYLPVAVAGYAVFGSDVDTNIINTVSRGPIRITTEILVAAHLFFAFLIIINPPALELEEVLHVPNSFNWKRVLLRSILMVFMVFAGESVPRFGKILNLIGGSAITLLTFIFPPIFYIKLCNQKSPEWPERKISIQEKICLLQIIIFGVVGGAAATYSALKDIADPNAFTPPCYLNITLGNS